MEFTCDAKALQAVTAQGLRTISTRGQVRVLSGLLLEATKTKLTVTSTDLELGGRVMMKLADGNPGKTVVPGKSFDNALRTFDGQITVEAEEGQARICQGRTVVSFDTYTVEDFPIVPTVDRKKASRVVVLAPFFKRAAVFATHAASQDQSRPVLQGVLLDVTEEDKLHMVATDSYRMAVTWAEATANLGALVHPSLPDGSHVIVRASAINEVCRLLKNDLDFVEITAATETQMSFKVGNVEFLARRIEGQFPNWQQLIPEPQVYEEEMVIEREPFAKSLDRVVKLGGKHSPVRLGFFRKDGKKTDTKTMVVKHMSQDSHSLTDELPVTPLRSAPKAGRQPLEIGINPQFALEAAKAFDTDNITMCIINPLRPSLFRGERDGESVLVMPIKLAG
jgi:DNA polymerase-3 subunit beta